MQTLPIGVQSFEKLRRRGDVYIDKTKYIKNLLDDGTVFFLSRPRRFGKSLLISTMEAYFQGRKDLFDGLEIAESEAESSDPWKKYPVIHFDFSWGEFTSEHGLAGVLDNTLSIYEKEYHLLPGSGDDLSVRFTNLLRGIFEKTGLSVVVLIDEYDHPLLANIGINPKLEVRNRDLFGEFFSVLKAQDRYLHFVFITGVTRFSKVSIFSDLNQLKDISLLPKYAAICGITDEEMQASLSPWIRAMAGAENTSEHECVQKLRQNYDGYHFSFHAPGVYNPFSLFNALSNQMFGKYWFETGTPSFLIRSLRASGINVKDFTDGVTASADDMMEYRAEDSNVIPLFYQTGYLTITGYSKEYDEYRLGYPNDEVKYGFLKSLLPSLSPQYAPLGRFNISDMIRHLEGGDADSFMTMIQALLGSIPYYEGKAPENEQQWRNLVYVVFAMLGQYVTAELHSSQGRSDFIVENEHYVYIFEFKQDQSAAEALRQIDENGYAVPYLSCRKKIVKIGASFSSSRKTLDEWMTGG